MLELLLSRAQASDVASASQGGGAAAGHLPRGRQRGRSGCQPQRARAGRRQERLQDWRTSDGVDAGFYINAYTAKQCPVMDGALEEMRRGLDRLQQMREADASAS